MARKALGRAQLELVQAVRRCLDQYAPGVGRVRVGLSGGADSLALTAALCHQPGLQVEAMIVDHGLQPDAVHVAEQVSQRARQLGAEVRVVRVQVAAEGHGVEAAARRVRYQALLEGDLPVLVGHTLDDQAEGVLLGLARGSGPVSLNGMAVQRDRILRPLLQVRRATTEQACREWGLEVWHDPMNDDESYRRVRVRQALPQLDAVLGPGLPQALARTADLLRHDNDLLEVLASQSEQECRRGLALDCVFLVHLHPALRGRVVRRWLVERGVEQPSWHHVQAVLALVVNWRGQLGVDLPGGVRVRRAEGQLVAEQQGRG